MPIGMFSCVGLSDQNDVSLTVYEPLVASLPTSSSVISLIWRQHDRLARGLPCSVSGDSQSSEIYHTFCTDYCLPLGCCWGVERYKCADHHTWTFATLHDWHIEVHKHQPWNCQGRLLMRELESGVRRFHSNRQLNFPNYWGRSNYWASKEQRNYPGSVKGDD